MPEAPAATEGLPAHMPVRRGPRLYLTGERTLPGIESETYWFCRHVAGYRWACDSLADSFATTSAPPSAASRRVLDSGCGEGYGTSMLAAATPATATVGIDLFADAAVHAATTYREAAFACGDAASLPFRAETFDAVVSLQVIEHLSDPDAYAAECSRVLRPGGTFLVGTPNRLTFTPPGRAKNPFHFVELSGDELHSLLARHFDAVEVEGLGDRHPGLADALIEAAFAGEDPPPWAAATVPGVTSEDFSVTTDVDGCLDLLARCRR